MTPSNEGPQSPMDRLNEERKSGDSRGFIKDTMKELLGSHTPKPEVKKPEEPKEVARGPEGIFGGKGISRSQFRQELAKAYDPKIHLKRPERISTEQEMTRQKYGEWIDEKKDIPAYRKVLKKETHNPDTKERIIAKERIKLLDKLEHKK